MHQTCAHKKRKTPDTQRNTEKGSDKTKPCGVHHFGQTIAWPFQRRQAGENSGRRQTSQFGVRRRSSFFVGSRSFIWGITTSSLHITPYLEHDAGALFGRRLSVEASASEVQQWVERISVY